LNLPAGIEGDTCLSMAIRYGRLADVMDILAESGERLTFTDLTAHKGPQADSLLVLAADTSQLEALMAPEHWVGRGRELQEIWRAVPVTARDKVDFASIQSEVNRLSLRDLARRNQTPKP
jgi:hypothetical protein